MFDVLAHAALAQLRDSKLENLGMGGQPSLTSISLEVKPLCAQLQSEYWKAVAIVSMCINRDGNDEILESFRNETLQRVIDGDRVPNRVEVQRMFARAREHLEKSVENTAWQKPSSERSMNQ